MQSNVIKKLFWSLPGGAGQPSGPCLMIGIHVGSHPQILNPGIQRTDLYVSCPVRFPKLNFSDVYHGLRMYTPELMWQWEMKLTNKWKLFSS